MFKASKLKCIFYDFDGVMTDNCVLIDIDGSEFVRVNRSDGYGVSCIRNLGIDQVIVSTENSQLVKIRADKLKIDSILGVANKGDTVRAYCIEHNISLEDTLFMGNDLNDFSAFEIVGFRAAPKDAQPEILNIVDWVSNYNGGQGAVRDLYRLISSKLNEEREKNQEK